MEYQVQVPEVNQSGDLVKGVGSVMVWSPCTREQEKDSK